MKTIHFGGTGLTLSPLGLGTGELGTLEASETQRLLDAARELGVRLIDTARSYAGAEERIGAYLAAHPGAFEVSTKLGYGVEGFEDWTGDCIRAGVDAACRRLRVERLGIAHLHSCPLEVLRRDEILRSLDDTVAAGKVAVAAYAGDNEALAFAVDSGVFGSVEASFSLCDQQNAPALWAARARGMGTVAKRVLANAPWRYAECPVHQEAEKTWDRWRELGLDRLEEPADAALRFALHHGPAHVVLIGTRNVDRLRSAVASVGKGPLAPELAGPLAERYREVGAGWPAII